MITRDTVLVLGAGASAHLGYPLGASLVQRILALQGTAEAQLISSLLQNQGCAETLDSMLDALLKSGRESIDAFLAHHPPFSLAGRLAIAACLIPHERPANLYSRGTDNWYRRLLSAMDAPFADFAKNRLSIITYNYDRSLEFFLLSCLENGYHAKSYSDCVPIIEQIPIVHV
ncbi:MAG: hypothetical protein KJ579_06130, partial [Verrucomicrobia bacterium]|nr:hypothetical protein [Verrucomicrobiota bacterium]